MTAPAGLGLEQPPEDAIVLFGGESLDGWEGGDAWQIADGVATAAKRGITTKDSFGDCQLHLEWASPDKVSGSGQGRGNSGVYLMGRYEIQILDSYDNDTYFDGQCGSLYKQRPPLVNVCRKPGEWQSYDIFFRGPRFDGNKLVTPGSVTVLHNGVLIQNNTTIAGNTAWDSAPALQVAPATAAAQFAVSRQPGSVSQYLDSRFDRTRRPEHRFGCQAVGRGGSGGEEALGRAEPD